MPKNTDPDFNTRLAAALAGDIEGTETTDLDGELNSEGGQKVLHHFKAKKIFVRGRGGPRFIVPENEGKAISKNWKKNIP